MSTYFPDKWLIIHIASGARSHFRVFACWYGGYLGGDSWKMNSGITRAELDSDGRWRFEGASGSEYIGHPCCYGMSGYGSGVLAQIMGEAHDSGTAVISILPEDTDWSTLDYTDGAPYVATETQSN